jgi:hypothetical protein
MARGSRSARHRSQQRAAHRAASAATHHQQIGVLGPLQQFGYRMALGHHEPDVDGVHAG